MSAAGTSAAGNAAAEKSELGAPTDELSSKMESELLVLQSSLQSFLVFDLFIFRVGIRSLLSFLLWMQRFTSPTHPSRRRTAKRATEKNRIPLVASRNLAKIWSRRPARNSVGQ